MWFRKIKTESLQQQSPECGHQIQCSDCTYAPAATGGPWLLWDGGSGSQGGLRSLWHRWFGTHWSPRGTRGGRSPETRDRFRLGLTTRRGLLWRTNGLVWFINRATGRPAFWSCGLGLGCWPMQKKNHAHNDDDDFYVLNRQYEVWTQTPKHEQLK